MKKIGPVLLILFVLALTMRVYQFGKIPYGLTADEASFGYNAYLLLHTGRDEHNRFLPLKFESFGDWKRPLYNYITIPFVGLFGLNSWAVRLPSLIAGLSLLPVTFLIAKKLTPKKDSFAPLLSTLLLTVSPWHFFFSRVALESMLSAALFTWAFYLLVFHHQKPKQLVTGFILFAFSIMSYYGALVTLSLWLGFYFLLYIKKNRHQKYWLAVIGGAFGLVIMLFINLFFSNENSKGAAISIFHLTNEEKFEQIYQYRNQSLYSKMRYNQYVYIGQNLFKNYLKTFDVNYLITLGGTHPLFGINGFGILLVPELALALVGVLWVLKNQTKERLALLAIVLITPIAGAVTTEATHNAREIYFLPATQILAGLGFFGLLDQVSRIKKVAAATITVSIVISAYTFYRFYFQEYALLSDHFFKGYFAEMSHYLFEVKDKYESVIITFPYESPYIVYAFYNQMDPEIFSSSISRFPKDRWGFRHVNRLEKLTFVESTKPILETPLKTRANNLIVARIGEIPKHIKPLKVWSNLNGEPEIVAFEERQL